MTLPTAQPYHWLTSDALDVAPRLLGYELISTINGVSTGGRIVEVEAYHGVIDAASHAHRGLTPRTQPMFEAGGCLYAYLSYGIHTCLNLVTGPAGEGQAVLIRALEPTVGIAAMAQRRHTTAMHRLTSGPGCVGQALGITVAMSGQQLGAMLTLRPVDTTTQPILLASGPRIGISQAKDHPWRFWIKANPFVTPPRI